MPRGPWRTFDCLEEFVTDLALERFEPVLGSSEDLYLSWKRGWNHEKKATLKRYPPGLKERVVRMVRELHQQDPGDKAVISRVARQFGFGDESLRSWVERSEIDAVVRAGLRTTEQEAAIFAGAESTAGKGSSRLHRHLSGQDTGGGRWRVEPISAAQVRPFPLLRRQVPSIVGPGRSVTPDWVSSCRAVEAQLLGLRRRKPTKAARRAGHDVGRDQVAHLMH
jgi:transposase-like protein